MQKINKVKSMLNLDEEGKNFLGKKSRQRKLYDDRFLFHKNILKATKGISYYSSYPVSDSKKLNEIPFEKLLAKPYYVSWKKKIYRLESDGRFLKVIFIRQ